MPHSPYNIPFVNDSGEEIPPYAVMRPDEITEHEGEWVFSVVQPDAVFTRRYLVNGPTAVPVDGRGMAADGSYPCLVSMVAEEGEEEEDEDVGIEKLGEGWGVVKNSWSLEQYRPGRFVAVAQSSEGVGLFRQESCDQLIIQLTEALKTGEKAKAKILYGSPPSIDDSEILLGENDDAGERGKVWDTEMDEGKELPIDAICEINFLNGAWYVTTYDTCPVDQEEEE